MVGTTCPRSPLCDPKGNGDLACRHQNSLDAKPQTKLRNNPFDLRATIRATSAFAIETILIGVRKALAQAMRSSSKLFRVHTRPMKSAKFLQVVVCMQRPPPDNLPQSGHPDHTNAQGRRKNASRRSQCKPWAMTTVHLDCEQVVANIPERDCALAMGCLAS